MTRERRGGRTRGGGARREEALCLRSVDLDVDVDAAGAG